MPLALIAALPRLMRWAIVASGTRKARQRDLRRSSECRMRAEEKQCQGVVVVDRCLVAADVGGPQSPLAAAAHERCAARRRSDRRPR
jgi:hypothetical protein